MLAACYSVARDPRARTCEFQCTVTKHEHGPEIETEMIYKDSNTSQRTDSREQVKRTQSTGEHSLFVLLWRHDWSGVGKFPCIYRRRQEPLLADTPTKHRLSYAQGAGIAIPLASRFIYQCHLNFVTTDNRLKKSLSHIRVGVFGVLVS